MCKPIFTFGKFVLKWSNINNALTIKVPACFLLFFPTLWNPLVRTKFSVIDQCKYKETNTMQFWNYMYVYICVCFDFTSILVSLRIKHKLNILEPIKIYKSHNYARITNICIVNRKLYQPKIKVIIVVKLLVMCK